jgi:hypothetical protein
VIIIQECCSLVKKDGQTDGELELTDGKEIKVIMNQPNTSKSASNRQMRQRNRHGLC